MYKLIFKATNKVNKVKSGCFQNLAKVYSFVLAYFLLLGLGFLCNEGHCWHHDLFWIRVPFQTGMQEIMKG